MNKNPYLPNLYIAPYLVGFALSLFLTLCAFALVWLKLFSTGEAMVALLSLAVAQFGVQLLSFFHFGVGEDARERIIALLFGLVIVCILTGGSLWIMQNLNDRMMPTTAQMEQYMQRQPGL